MWTDVLDLAASLRAEREPFVLATVVARDRPQSVPLGARAVVRSDGSVTGWVGGGCVRPVVVDEALQALRDGRPRLVRVGVPEEDAPPPGVRIYPMTCHGGGRVEVYVEPIQPKPRLVVFGLTPVASALTSLAGPLGFETVVAAPGAEAGAFPDAHRVADTFEEGAEAARSGFVVVATQGEGDEDALRAALGGAPAYVGMVASRKKAAAVLDFLRAEGVSDEALARVRAPAGLDLGGMEPAEIALSILAELVSIRAGSARGEGHGRGEHAAHAPVGEPAAAPARDPVCGMTVDPETARYVSEFGGASFYFCCPMCQAAFDRDPGSFAGATTD